MRLTITITQQGAKPAVRVTEVDKLTLADLRKLWEAEQTLNNLPGANLRVHIDVEDK